ncbi:hypothetical protein HYFRA_00008663 [Hymenoscyphus fraxineus]|uniref:Uncharacterized protein n=1 Tax=Hymenoscyphus fraxineus TaxID=746836 RepID=A0A9N9KW54_9HELO|nr:hypothetical protein HYFRA_00008663 [Hymenoscyphus fraxineus]
MQNPPSTTTNPVPATTQIWQLANRALLKCANHPEEMDKVMILSEYLDDAKDILTEAFKSGEIDEESFHTMVQSETEWVAVQWETLLVKAEIRELVRRIDWLETREA